MPDFSKFTLHPCESIEARWQPRLWCARHTWPTTCKSGITDEIAIDDSIQPHVRRTNRGSLRSSRPGSGQVDLARITAVVFPLFGIMLLTSPGICFLLSNDIVQYTALLHRVPRLQSRL
ncbi:hypothetical protein K456DRAFT_840065 [Colletotrichum gloeosporioides 23]|nr:hypothetical protein K456DRAFT_840065 [Colletotrichum gloeosporioides 23]